MINRLGLGLPRSKMFIFGVNIFKDATAAYSLRDLGLGADSVVRVRRDSDNAEQDFTSSEITDGTLTTFCGSNDGFVSVWYDQSSNGNNATQATAASQPKIVSSGTVIKENSVPALDFDGSDDFITVSSSLYSNVINMFTTMKVLTTTSSEPSYYQRIVHLTDGANSYQITRASGTAGYELLSKNSEYNTSTDSLDWGTHNGQFLLSAQTDNTLNSDEIYIDGVSQSEGGENIPIGAGDNSKSTFGARDDLLSSSFFEGSIQEIIIYDTDKSADRTDIESDIATYFNITI
jgi:hypothetical protein